MGRTTTPHRPHPDLDAIFDARKGENFFRYWRIDMAVEAAVAEGKRYISWNGWVYPIVDGHISFERRACLTTDIEGLEP